MADRPGSRNKKIKKTKAAMTVPQLQGDTNRDLLISRWLQERSASKRSTKKDRAAARCQLDSSELATANVIPLTRRTKSQHSRHQSPSPTHLAPTDSAPTDSASTDLAPSGPTPTTKAENDVLSAVVIPFTQARTFIASVEIDELTAISTEYPRNTVQDVLTDVAQLMRTEFGSLAVRRHRRHFEVFHDDFEVLVAGILRVQFFSNRVKLPTYTVFGERPEQRGVTLTWGVGRTTAEALAEREKKGRAKRQRNAQRALARAAKNQPVKPR